MSRALAEIAKEAVELPEKQRFELVNILLSFGDHSTHTPEETQTAWDSELARCMEKVKSGVAIGRPWEAVLADVNKKLNA